MGGIEDVRAIKELIEKILAYLADFGSLFAGPKRFIAQRNTRAEETFAQALIFLGVSGALVVIMTAPLLPPGKDLWTYVGTTAITWLLAVTLGAIALRIAWRLVGGKATVRSFFVTYAYYFSVLVVILTFFIFWVKASLRFSLQISILWCLMRS